MRQATISNFAGRTLLGLVAVLAVVAGCSDQSRAEGYIRHFYMNDERVYLTVDPQTGCEYIAAYKAALVPRIAADGKTHMGCREAK